MKDKVIKALLELILMKRLHMIIYPLENKNIDAGMGCIGELPEALTEEDFLKLVSSVFVQRDKIFKTDRK